MSARFKVVSEVVGIGAVAGVWWMIGAQLSTDSTGEEMAVSLGTELRAAGISNSVMERAGLVTTAGSGTASGAASCFPSTTCGPTRWDSAPG